MLFKMHIISRVLKYDFDAEMLVKCKVYLAENFLWFSEDAVIGNCNVMRDDDVNTRKVFIET